MNYSSDMLDLVFGPGSKGATPETRAATSKQEFVRSQTQLSFANDRAKGPRITASKALGLVGIERLVEALDKGAVILDVQRSDLAHGIQRRREALRLSVAEVAKAAGLKAASIETAEDAVQVTPIRDLHRISQAVGIELDDLGKNVQRADNKLGLRLRTLRDPAQDTRLSASVVLALAEASWIIALQDRLSKMLNEEPPLASSFTPITQTGEEPWKAGFRLAAETRGRLGTGPREPIPSMRNLLNEMGVPLVQRKIDQRFAGATLQNGAVRGIVVNLDGDNWRPWVRRVTLAHELGHYLWDPVNDLNGLHVDRYADLRNMRRERRDALESRANAFAVAFLAPPDAVLDVVRADGPAEDQVAALMTTFGISATAAKYHLSNISREWGRPLATDKVASEDLPAGEDLWRAQEDYTMDFFPLKDVPLARRGRFAKLVARAWSEKLITLDDAAIYLKTSSRELEGFLPEISRL